MGESKRLDRGNQKERERGHVGRGGEEKWKVDRVLVGRRDY